ncbi:MAG: TIGR03087 family PEP-CTERM/XrtA system glycosyltransferase [Candidatus Competibacteraceae bacterium]
MEELLFLVHRIPYPPNKGDKIRSYHLLEYLAKRYRVHLGTFIDTPEDWCHVDAVRALCGELHIADLGRGWRRLSRLAGLWGKGALTVAYYHHAGLQRWVDQVVRDFAIRRVLVFSSAMAQYVEGPAYRHLHRVIDFVDVDSEKWAQYSRRRPWPLSWLYRRESRTLSSFEQRVATAFSASIFVTAAEAALFQRQAPDAVHVTHVSNGVDSDFFDPELEYLNPYLPTTAPILVFTGAMDYWANIDAVCWFAREVLPLIRRRLATAQFAIVGARPAVVVRQLERLPGVQVIGAVADIRPYLAHAHVAVAPLRIARGLQNKVLEAMAMAKPILLTRAAADGLLPCSVLEPWIADTPRSLANLAVRLLTDEDRGVATPGRRWVQQHHNWSTHLNRFEHLLESELSPAVTAEYDFAGGVF